MINLIFELINKITQPNGCNTWHWTYETWIMITLAGVNEVKWANTKYVDNQTNSNWNWNFIHNQIIIIWTFIQFTKTAYLIILAGFPRISLIRLQWRKQVTTFLTTSTFSLLSCLKSSSRQKNTPKLIDWKFV